MDQNSAASITSAILTDAAALDSLLREPQGLERLLAAAEQDITLAHGILNDVSLALLKVEGKSLAGALAAKLPRPAFAALKKEPRLATAEGFIEALIQDSQVTHWLAADPALVATLGMQGRIQLQTALDEFQQPGRENARRIIAEAPPRSVPVSRGR